MKIIEQVVSPNKVKTETVLHGNKKYFRVTYPKKKFTGLQEEIQVEWRRHKTNHQVKKSEHDVLEKEYLSKFFKKVTSPDPHFAGRNMFASGSTIMHQFTSDAPIVNDDEERRGLERDIVRVSENGKYKLAAIKHIKEKTGWGLKEAKDFVYNFFERKEKFLADKPASVSVGISKRGSGLKVSKNKKKSKR